MGKCYGFIVPRFGEGIAGGAESLVGAIAKKLFVRGDDVLILSTCARDNRTWENFYPEGDAIEFGIPVKRFLVDKRNLEIWIPHQINISEGLRLSLDAQLDWMQHGVNSSALYEFIKTNAYNFDALFFAPYLFGTTFFGSLVRPDKSILIPCLHDENYAYTEIAQSMFRQVKGALFNSIPEKELACSLFGSVAGGEVGMGFEANGHKQLAPYFKEKFPYLLYVGRKETGKNVQLLVDYFIELKGCEEVDPALRLVIVGGGDFSDLQRPGVLDRGDILDIFHVSEEEKQRLIAKSLCLCQPSKNESFSIVIMEAWLHSVPVIVHAGCAVTKHHVCESGGGLYFSSAEDFCAVVDTLISDADLCKKLGQSGKSYVEEKYNWQAVLERFDMVVEGILG